MQIKNIQPFILKAVESINDQPNENGPNSKINSLYNVLKAKWMLNYGTMRFQPHHMNYILFETWEAFTVSDGNIIRDILAKTHQPPLVPPNTITNTQACVASIQKYSKGINHIAEYKIVLFMLQVTRANEHMVIIRAKGSIQQQQRNIHLWAVAYDTVKNRTVLPLQEIHI